MQGSHFYGPVQSINLAEQMEAWAEEPASAPDAAILGAGLHDMANKITAADYQSALERMMQHARTLHEKQVRRRSRPDLPMHAA